MKRFVEYLQRYTFFFNSTVFPNNYTPNVEETIEINFCCLCCWYKHSVTGGSDTLY